MIALELIEKWAQKADTNFSSYVPTERDVIFAALVEEHVREQIASHYGAQPHVEHFGSNIADEIRARGTPNDKTPPTPEGVGGK